MKKFCLILFSAVFALISNQSIAQSTTEIMDAKINWSSSGASNHGILKVYLTDSQDLQTVTVKIGSVSDSSDLYNQQYNINSLPAGSSLNNNVVTIDLGSFSSHPDYFIATKISLSGNEEREIQIHSSN
ncbi:MAG: hypothetical protein WCI97_09940 [Bacteroidota bacterium]